MNIFYKGVNQMKSQPSEAAMIKFLEYLMKTYVPRLLAKKESEKKCS
jgi:hypothetical protein